MNKLTINEKIKLIISSSKDYRGVFLIGMSFITIGGILIFFGLRFDTIFLVIFGSIFACFSLFFILYTIPSSLIYSYDKALIKKYGKTTNAYLLEKEIIDSSYYDAEKYAIATNKKGKSINELNYLLTFSFEYQNKSFDNSEFIEKTQFEKLKIGDLIPIKFLSIDPAKSSIRKIKLKRMVHSKS